MPKKIATSASFFSCPPINAILQTCEIVYTSNWYALTNFKHPNVQEISKYVAGEDCEVVTFSDLFQLFNEWCAYTATDEELLYWRYYWKCVPTKIRERATNLVEARKKSRIKSDVPTT